MGNSSVGWNSSSSLKRTIEWLTSTRHTSTRHNNWITAGTRHSGVYYTDRGSDSQRSEVIQGSSARDADARNEGGMMCPSCPPPTVGQWGSWVCVCTLESTFVKYASTVSRTKGCVHSRMRRRRQTSMPTAVGISLRSGNAYCSRTVSAQQRHRYIRETGESSSTSTKLKKKRKKGSPIISV